MEENIITEVEVFEVPATETTTTETIVITEDSFGENDWEQLNALFAQQATLLSEQQEALNHIYAGQVFSISLITSVLVCLLLYKFIKMFV